MTADSLCTYMASGQRSHKVMCPGLAEQYFLMPDTKTFIGCPCTTFLPVPPCYILSECVYVPHQAQVVCRDEHNLIPRRHICFDRAWPETSIYPFCNGEEIYTQESRFNIFLCPLYDFDPCVPDYLIFV